ncbi:hypothetical protein NPIL_89211 [Nephila pilipes]|uniref:Uncharacterized protein n=1 Tax=Nephila pilipes TaxID=299642 RepID=A0A8X6ULU4_NEPPI|nr:hypothetical protein NPIL_89211 [Nephila pilipes]
MLNKASQVLFALRLVKGTALPHLSELTLFTGFTKLLNISPQALPKEGILDSFKRLLGTHMTTEHKDTHLLHSSFLCPLWCAPKPMKIQHNTPAWSENCHHYASLIRLSAWTNFPSTLIDVFTNLLNFPSIACLGMTLPSKNSSRYCPIFRGNFIHIKPFIINSFVHLTIPKHSN